MTAGRELTADEQQWMEYIRHHLVENLSIDRDDFDAVPVLSSHGGWGRANRVFDGQLDRAPRRPEQRAGRRMTDVVGKLWGFCHILRHDGIDYGDYIEQITYLLFLKMADERGIDLPTYTEFNAQTGQAEQISCDWPYLRKQSRHAADRHTTSKLLTQLGKEHGILGDIFAGAQSRFTNPVNLHKLIRLIDETEWTGPRRRRQGRSLRRAAGEGGGRGQEGRRPVLHAARPHPEHRPLHEARPARNHGLHDRRPGLRHRRLPRRRLRVAQGAQTEAARSTATPPSGCASARTSARNWSPRPRRLALMNLYLHQVEPHITLGDSIYEVPSRQRFDVILTNPPFGTKGANQAPGRDDFTVATSNKQLNFIQHVLTILKPGGRAPSSCRTTCSSPTRPARSSRFLMEDCDVHTVLRCPRGTFSPYTQGTKTNVIFFTKGRATEKVWIYDARANVPKITKKSRPLSAAHFAEFERCYGADPNGRSERTEADSTEGRWRCFAADEVRQHHYKLSSLKWIRDEESDDLDDLPEPEESISDALQGLRRAVATLTDIQRLVVTMTAPTLEADLTEMLASRLSDTDTQQAGPASRLSNVTRSVEQFRLSILGAACAGRVTADWRSLHTADAGALFRQLRVYRLARNRKPIAEPQEDLVDDIPAGWRLVTLDLLLRDIEAGKSFSALGRPADPDEWGVIKVSAMSWGNFLADENKAVPEGQDITHYYEIKPGDLLLSRANTEELVGATVLVGETRPRLLLSDKSLRLIPEQGVDRSWLNYTLRSPLVRRQFSTLATGTSDSMRNLSQDKILSATVPLPPTDEQVDIGKRVSVLLSMADSLIGRG